jgi:hypothetical protein
VAIRLSRSTAVSQRRSCVAAGHRPEADMETQPGNFRYRCCQLGSPAAKIRSRRICARATSWAEYDLSSTPSLLYHVCSDRCRLCASARLSASIQTSSDIHLDDTFINLLPQGASPIGRQVQSRRFVVGSRRTSASGPPSRPSGIAMTGWVPRELPVVRALLIRQELAQTQPV